METVQEFPTYGDIYSIYRNKTIQKLRKKRKPYTAKLLETLFKMYPDLKRFVTEKSLSIKHLQKCLIRILQLSRTKEKYLIKKKNFFEILLSNSDNKNSVNVTKDPDSDENSVNVTKDPHSDETSISVTKDPHSDENSVNVNKDPHSDENSVNVNKDPHSDENSVSVPGQEEEELATKTSRDDLKRKHSQNKEIEDAKRYCVANIWSGYPTIGSIYSTSKLESVRKLKEAQKQFIPLMLKILISKYSRLKILLTDSHLSDDCITDIFLYILKRAEMVEQNFCKKEKRKFLKTIFHSETLSNILIKFSHNKETYPNLIVVENNKNESVVLDTKDERNTTNNLSDIKENVNEIEHLLDRVPESVEATIPSDSVKMHLSQYLKTLKAKYACIQNELSKKRNVEKSLEKKLNYLLNKQKKYKHKIKKYRKEIIEYECSKSICES